MCQRLGGIALRRLQVGQRGQVPWLGQGTRIMLVSHQVRVMALGTITREIYPIDVWLATTLARDPRTVVLMVDPALSSPEVDPDQSLALRDSGRLAHDFPRRASDCILVKLMEMPALDKFFMLQIMRCVSAFAGRGMLIQTAANAVMLDKWIRQPDDVEALHFPGGFVGHVWFEAHHAIRRHLEEPSPSPGIFGEIPIWNPMRSNLAATILHDLQVHAHASDRFLDFAALPLEVAWEAQTAVSAVVDGIVGDPVPIGLVVHEWLGGAGPDQRSAPWHQPVASADAGGRAALGKRMAATLWRFALDIHAHRGRDDVATVLRESLGTLWGPNLMHVDMRKLAAEAAEATAVHVVWIQRDDDGSQGWDSIAHVLNLDEWNWEAHADGDCRPTVIDRDQGRWDSRKASPCYVDVKVSQFTEVLDNLAMFPDPRVRGERTKGKGKGGHALRIEQWWEDSLQALAMVAVHQRAHVVVALHTQQDLLRLRRMPRFSTRTAMQGIDPCLPLTEPRQEQVQLGRLLDIGTAVLCAKPFALMTTPLGESNLDKLTVMKQECMQYKLLSREGPMDIDEVLGADVPLFFNGEGDLRLQAELDDWAEHCPQPFADCVQAICENFQLAARPPRAVFRPRQAEQPVQAEQTEEMEAHRELLDMLHRVPLATWHALNDLLNNKKRMEIPLTQVGHMVQDNQKCVPFLEAKSMYEKKREELQRSVTAAWRQQGQGADCFLPSFWLSVFGTIWPRKVGLQDWHLQQTGPHQYALIHKMGLVQDIEGPSLPSSGSADRGARSERASGHDGPPAKYPKRG